MGFFQEISNRTHWTDLEKTWVSNSSSNFVWGPLGRSHSNFDGIFGGFKFWWNFGGEILTAITLLIFVDLWYSTIPLPKMASPGFSKWINTGYKPLNPGKNSRNCHYCKRGSHLQRASFSIGPFQDSNNSRFPRRKILRWVRRPPRFRLHVFQ